MINRLKENKLVVLVIAIYISLFVFMPNQGVSSAKNSLYYLKEMFQVLPVIFLLTVLIDAWIPKEVIMDRFGENSGIKGNVLSLILGSISAGPIYAAFPICKTLIKKGSSITNIVIILSAWAVVKVPMLANEAKFLGVKFMTVRWILTVIAIFIMGYIVSKFVKKEDLPSEDVSKRGLIEIQENYCVGCGVCAKLSPSYYEMQNKKARLIEIPKNKTECEKIIETAKKCPVGAIKVYEKK